MKLTKEWLKHINLPMLAFSFLFVVATIPVMGVLGVRYGNLSLDGFVLFFCLVLSDVNVARRFAAHEAVEQAREVEILRLQRDAYTNAVASVLSPLKDEHKQMINIFDAMGDSLGSQTKEFTKLREEVALIKAMHELLLIRIKALELRSGLVSQVKLPII
jgi:hypothetical protein